MSLLAFLRPSSFKILLLPRWPRLLGLLTALLLLAAGCHRTVPFDTKLAEEQLAAEKVGGPARPPTPDSTGSQLASKRDTLTTARDITTAPSIQTAKMKEDADKLAKDKAQAKKDRRELGRKAESAIKKLKGNTFLGKRMKKGFARSGGSGKSGVIEKFYYLPKYEEPNPYAPAKYYYHRKKHKIFKASVIDPKVALILHGPYEKRQNGLVIESGFFYVGTKHLRWERNAQKDNILLSKVHWEKGFPRDARITYHDQGRKKIEEVIPYAGEKLEGDYVRFLPNGQLEWTGEFQGGRHVGLWTNFWGFRNRRRYQWQYPESEFEPEAEPYLLREYNRNGGLIYEKGKVDKRAQNELQERRAGAQRGKKPAAKAVAEDGDEEESGDATEAPAATKAPATKGKPAAKAKPEKGAKPASKEPAPTTKAPAAKAASDSTGAAPTPPARLTPEQARERMRQQMSRPKLAPRKQP